MQAKSLSGAEVRLDEVAVGDGGDLRAGVEVLGKSGDTRIRIGRKRRIVLVEVLEAERIFLCRVVVDVGDGQVRGESAGSGDKRVIKMSDGGRNAAKSIVRDKPFAGLAGKCG